jgi:hypothetical protein
MGASSPPPLASRRIVAFDTHANGGTCDLPRLHAFLYTPVAYLRGPVSSLTRA